ncbi:GTP pyrophosphokinase [Antrihabitans cavernicola]|uniref:RelA/SpoT protein n=1 Tax=Antrihabitans cavernicola TaxID=2495913 RepID=A0A5A7S9V5_9NOCA|nr:RelA/SpoT protein [Spelaeibacter cavernicola]KAA0022686.1 RelA/SpoT protein [Spelaeibacter cavernicola]
MEDPESDNIDELIDALYAERKRAWDAALVSAQSFLDTISDEILDNLDRDRLNADTTRIKDRGRAAGKIKRKIAAGECEPPTTVDDVEQALNDYVGIKVLCKSPRDLAAFTDALDTACHLPDCSIRFAKPPADYVKEPKPSGYRAYHAVLLVPVASHQGDLTIKVEVQVKTRLQDAWGELTHEDMYKPGEALKPTDFHRDYASEMAELLARVDGMADRLAVELDNLTEPSEPVEVGADPLRITARVTRTGPRYALAVGPDGRRGLIPARSVRDKVGSNRRINVSDYIAVGDHIDVIVDDTSDALYYRPAGQLKPSHK